MLNKYIINLQGVEITIYQDEDGKFIKPDIIKEYESIGTALKPANEPIVVARKPISEKTVAENVLKWGTGGINIDCCRVEYEDTQNPATNPLYRKQNGYKTMCGNDNEGTSFKIKPEPMNMNINPQGRFPANIILDEEAGELLNEQSGERKSGGKVKGDEPSRTGQNGIYGTYGRVENQPYVDTGGASRFFYCAKTSKTERGEGNNHPTVKPLKLIEYLCKLITPLNGIVIDPFMGSGTTAIACKRNNFNFIGFDNESTYCDISNKRIAENT